MADDKKEPAVESTSPAEPAQPASAPESRAAEQTDGDAARLGAEVVKLEGQIADLTDRLLRAHADIDNLRKRAERERIEAGKYAITKFARDIVNVADNFQRAVGAVSPDAAAENAALAGLLEGVGMTERELLNVMERHGVKRIDPAGQIFDPHQHQAVMEMQNADVPAGTVLQVFQSGYMIEDRCLRPAMVVVAKGGQKGAKPAAAEPAAKAQNGDTRQEPPAT